MRKILLLALLLALPWMAAGEGSDVIVDAFIERTGIETDAAMREKIDGFLREMGIKPSALRRMSDDRLARYADYLQRDLPISYAWMMEDSPSPLPAGTEITQLMVLYPQAGATESALVDFVRGRVYYDETFPVIRDVCQAEWAAPLAGADAARLREMFLQIEFGNQIGEIGPVDADPVWLAAAHAQGVSRCAAMGTGVSERFIDGVWTLLQACRDAAQGGAHE